MGPPSHSQRFHSLRDTVVAAARDPASATHVPATVRRKVDDALTMFVRSPSRLKRELDVANACITGPFVLRLALGHANWTANKLVIPCSERGVPRLIGYFDRVEGYVREDVYSEEATYR